MVTLNAHFDGKTIIVDGPVFLPLPIGARLKLSVELLDNAPAVAPAPSQFQPLDITIDRELSNAIALEPQFNIEET